MNQYSRAIHTWTQVEAGETEVVRDQMQREGIELISGTARFLPGAPGEPHRVMVLRTSEEAESKTRRGLEPLFS